MKLSLLKMLIGLSTMMWMGCTKHPLPSPCKFPDCSDTIKYVFKKPDSLGTLPILWYTLAHAPDSSASNQWCYATEDGVILVNESQQSHNNKVYVRFLDRTIGEEKWYWDKIPEDHLSDVQFYPDRNMIGVKYFYYDAVLDTRTGEEILFEKEPSELKYKQNNFAIIGDYYYTSVYDKSSDPHVGSDNATLIRTRLSDGKNWEKIFIRSEEEINGYTPYFYNLKLWVDPNTHDSIILINNRLYHWEKLSDGYPVNQLERTDLVAFNLNKRKVEWTIDSICKSSSIMTQFILVENNMFFQEGSYLSKIDLLNPGIKEFQYHNFGGSAVYDETNNSLIGASMGLASVGVDNYKINWKHELFPFNINGIELFEGYAYVSAPHGELYVINATTGKIVFKQFSVAMFVPQSILGMRGRASVDRVNRLLYCSDLWGTYCLKLPDKWE